MKNMKNLTFKNGDKLPAIGLGTWKSDPGDVFKAVIEAIKAGYRHIDCAPIYGNEAEVGQAIEKVVADQLLKREELWVTSKLWNDSHERDQVIPALKKTLKDLNLDYLDLYLIHWPVALEPGVSFPKKPEDFKSLKEVPLIETWKGMEEALDEGLTRHIGVSNFNQRKIETLLQKGSVKPEMNQVEMHPLLPQKDLVEYCNKHGIHSTAYSPLGSRDRPAKAKSDDEPNLFEVPVIVDIAEKHDCTPAQVLISWAIHRGTAVIPKSVSPGHIRQNLEAVDINLDTEDMNRISELDKEYRYIDGSLWAMEGSPYTLEGLWEN